MPSRESRIVEGLVRHLERRHGAYVQNMHGSGLMIGRLDLTCCVRGRFVAIEVKAPGARRGATRRQLVEADRIRARGGIAFVARTTADIDRELRAALGEEPS